RSPSPTIAPFFTDQLSGFSFAFHPSSVLPSNILIHLPGFSAPDADPMAAMSAANMQKFDLRIHNLQFWNPRSIVLGVSPVMLRVHVSENSGPPCLRKSELPYADARGPLASFDHAARRERLRKVHAAAFDLLRITRRGDRRVHLQTRPRRRSDRYGGFI